MTKLLTLQNITHNYFQGGEKISALDNVNLTLTAGEMIALMGPSGSGKSTALLIAGLLTRPSSGQLFLCGEKAPSEEAKRAHIRNEIIGFVHQRYTTIDHLNAVDNVAIPLEYRRPPLPRGKRRQIAIDKLRSVHLDESIFLRKTQAMSGGQKQRVAIARALSNNPRLLLADEPTAALDSAMSREILHLFRNFANDNHGVIIATHDATVADQCDRILTIVDGVIQN